MRAASIIFVFWLVATTGCSWTRHKVVNDNDGAAGSETKKTSSEAGSEKDASQPSRDASQTSRDASIDANTTKTDSGPICGNNKIEGRESCDGTDLGGETCLSLTNSQMRGTLGCAKDCQSYDLSGCYSISPYDGGQSDGGTVIRDAGRTSSLDSASR
jgi:hypothetical protein